MHKLNVILASVSYVMLLLFGCIPVQYPSPTNTVTSQLIAKSCPTVDNSSAFQISSTDIPTLSILHSEIESFLNSGGNILNLRPLIFDSQNNTIGSLEEIDLDDDGINEFILSTSSPNGADRKFGWVGVYNCNMGKYIASYSELGPYIE